MSEWYKGVRVESMIGIRRDGTDGLDAVLTAAGAPQSVFSRLDRHTQLEPLHVELIDAGYNATNTPRILVLDAAAIQIDGGLNEIPRAVCELATGRDGTAMAAGVSSSDAVSVAHVVERYLNKFVKVRIYAKTTTTSAAGAPDGELGDVLPEPNEWVVLFYGITNGTTRRGDPSSFRLMLHISHFTAVLGFSSSLAAGVAPGTDLAYAMNAAFFRSPLGAQPAGGQQFSAAGFVASSLAGGAALYTDFWGFDAEATQTTTAQGGLKRFLLSLAGQDLFDWQAFARADLGGSFCPDYFSTGGLNPFGDTARKNDRAIEALRRIEPIRTTAAPLADWTALGTAVTNSRAGYTADGSTRAVDRADLIRRAPVAYRSVGYRYGAPVSFYLNDAILGPFSLSRSFAADVCAATLTDLAPSSFWELLVSRYAGRYQIALAPMADRALVIPFQPLLNGSWQTVYASEVFSWDDDVRNAEPVRGVVLVSERRSDAGWLTAGSSGALAAQSLATADAAYDSCDDGVFVYRAMPQWLVAANRHPAAWAARSALGARATSAVPWTTAVAAEALVHAAVRDTPAAAGKTIAEAYRALGLTPGAPAVPTELSRSTANRMARALYQQTKTSPHTVYVTGRFRYDIAPGSVIDLQLPGDRFVRGALVGARDTRMTGIVVRTTLSIDRERMQAVTAFQIGFARTESETATGHPLYSDVHPFWTCACYGAPWSDSVWVRNRLGDRADIKLRVL